MEFEEFVRELKKPKENKDIFDQVMLEYFLSQLKLYGLLCQNRNYACVKNMQELLP